MPSCLRSKQAAGVTFSICGHQGPTAMHSVGQSQKCPKKDYTGDRGKNQVGGLHFSQKCAPWSTYKVKKKALTEQSSMKQMGKKEHFQNRNV